MIKITLDGIIFSLQRAGGISVYFRTLLESLSREKFDATLIIEEPLSQQLDDYHENISKLSRKARRFERYRSCRLPEKKSIFHSSYYRLPENTNSPTVVTVHDFTYERFSRGPRKWVHSKQKFAAIRAAQAVICVSEATRQDFIEFVGETKGQTVHVIHNGVGDIFQPAETGLNNKLFILFVGQRAGYKNFKLVLSALRYLPDMDLYCVGGGAFKTYELNGFSDDLVKRVHHLGFVTDKELNALYNHAVCLVYPSSYEGFGIPVIEAMRAGCPVVSSNCKAVLEVGGLALSVVFDDDPRAMSDAILNTLSSSRIALIQRGLAVAKDYSWDKTHRQTLDVYRILSASVL